MTQNQKEIQSKIAVNEVLLLTKRLVELFDSGRITEDYQKLMLNMLEISYLSTADINLKDITMLPIAIRNEKAIASIITQMRKL